MLLRQNLEKLSLEWNKAIASAKSEKVGLRLLRDKKRWLCRNDLFYLCCITGHDRIAKYPEIYKPFCDEVSLMNWKIVQLNMHKPSEDMLPVRNVIEDEKEIHLQRLYLCYRTFYKTSIITRLHTLQLLLNFPNIHICINHNKQINASDNLVTIKDYFLTTELKVLFPEYIPKGKEWGNMTGFSVACRKDKNRVEDNIEAAGVDTEITGRHYEIAKKNDLVTEKSVTTEEQLKKTLDWDERFNIGHFDDPQIKLQDYEGTRYHFADLYSIRKNNPNIKLIEIPLLKDGNPDNITLENIHNPKRFSVEGIESLKKDMWVFHCQMLLRPEDPARMHFDKSMIVYYGEIPSCVYYLLVDPASARKKKSDFTAMLVVGIDSEGNRYIADGLRDKLDPKQRIDKAIELARKWNIKGCGWEAITFQTTDCFYLEERRRIEGLFFSIEEVKSHKIAKEDRIRGLLPEYAQHKWFWPQKGACIRHSFFDGKNYDLTEALEYELLQFPLAEHDDLCDVQTFLNRISTIQPQKIKTVESTEMTFGEYAEIREGRELKLQKDPWKRLKIGAYV